MRSVCLCLCAGFSEMNRFFWGVLRDKYEGDVTPQYEMLDLQEVGSCKKLLNKGRCCNLNNPVNPRR